VPTEKKWGAQGMGVNFTFHSISVGNYYLHFVGDEKETQNFKNLPSDGVYIKLRVCLPSSLSALQI
jgi:hypothetical protein